MSGTIHARTKLFGVLGAAALAAAFGCGQAIASAWAGSGDLASAERKQGYSLGWAIGTEVSQTLDGVDLVAVVRGFEDAAQRREASLAPGEMQQALVEYQVGRAEAARAEIDALAAANAAAGEAYRAEFARQSGVTTLESGLQYRVIEPGAGDPPAEGESVTLHYRGHLVDGTALDDSWARGEPITVSLEQVLPGWKAALERMPEGARWEVVVPPSLAYGETGAPGFVEPNATLVFEFERVAS